MLVLPNTPPVPASSDTSKLDTNLNYERAALAAQAVSSYSELAKFVVAQREYLDHVIDWCYENVDLTGADIVKLVQYSRNQEIDSRGSPKWQNINRNSSGFTGGWYVVDELKLLILAISLAYSLMAATVISDLIELPDLNSDTDEKWKSVVNFYKTGLSYLEFYNQLLATGSDLTSSFIIQYLNVNLQLSILVKHSWLNRQEYDTTESFTSLNNNVLARVSIYALDELKKLKNLAEAKNSLLLDTSNWNEYFDVSIKYVSAYAGYFLAIEKYQQNKLGEALGLVNFSILTLQRKNFESNTTNPVEKSTSSTEGKLLKLKGKLKSKRHEMYLNKIQSISTLKINKLAFQNLLGSILKDIEFLFDQLILLRTKLEKENNNIAFQDVISWADIHSDSKWPIGTPINVTPVAPFQPRCISNTTSSTNSSNPYY